MTESSLVRLFENLALRRRKENDLSDLTWALSKSVPDFAQLFVGFCSPTPMPSGVRVEREWDLGQGARVDFACFAPNLAVIIESKIYDRNYHLKQYKAGAPVGTALSLIVNHALAHDAKVEAAELGWRVCKWREFAAHLEASPLVRKDQLVASYLTYLKAVCDMVEIRRLQFEPDSLYSLVSLNALLDEAVGGASHGGFRYGRYAASARATGPGWCGVYYHLKHEPSGAQVWPFFGLIFEKPAELCLCMQLDADWNSLLLSKLPSPGDLQIDGFTVLRLRDGAWRLRASDEECRNLLSGDLATQKKQLLALFQRANRVLEKYLPSATPAPAAG